MKNIYQQFINLGKAFFIAFIVTILLSTTLFIITSNFELAMGMGIVLGILTYGFESAKYKNKVLALMSLIFLSIGFAILCYYESSDLPPLLSGIIGGIICFVFISIGLCIGFIFRKIYNRLRKQ